MPKCEFDPDFQGLLQRFASDNAFTVNGAATALGVDRTVFRRAYKFGIALESTKKKILKALEKSSRRVIFDDAVSVAGGAPQSIPLLHGVLADCELKQIRRACESVLALLDHYEAQTVGRKIQKQISSPAETQR